MTVLQFGYGWPDGLGRRRTLLWVSELGWGLFDDGREVRVIRRGLYDEIGLRACLLGWEDHVDEPTGADWAEDRLSFWPPSVPDPHCMICQGEGSFAGPDGQAARCGCERTT